MLHVANSDAERVRAVQDNLCTPGTPALYATFSRAEAWRCRCLEFNPPPKPGSWLNMARWAEIEITIVARNCLARLVGNVSARRARPDVLEVERNGLRCMVTWQFTTTGLAPSRMISPSLRDRSTYRGRSTSTRTTIVQLSISARCQNERRGHFAIARRSCSSSRRHAR